MESVAQVLTERFGFLKDRPSQDCPAFYCPQDKVHELLLNLRDDFGYTFLTDVTAIDQYEQSPRFEVVYHLLHLDRAEYLRIVTPCPSDGDPRCVSVTDIWPAADWHERETYDMFGITFEGHPDLRRILMWDGYPHFPLRKEFPLAGVETEIPAPDFVEQTEVRAQPAPMMGGPFHSGQKGPMSRREPRADDESWTERRPRDKQLPAPAKPREFRQTES